MPASTDAAALSLLSSRVRDVPDYPKPGILFKDITPLLADAQALQEGCAEALTEGDDNA